MDISDALMPREHYSGNSVLIKVVLLQFMLLAFIHCLEDKMRLSESGQLTIIN